MQEVEEGIGTMERDRDQMPDPQTPPEVPSQDPREDGVPSQDPQEEGLPVDDPDGEEVGAEAPLA